ncbi:sigma-70 family RNA polymerase sigma factor [Glycomyces luteolus]|uniref:Sigma-70 family RNA polymerase sigma factor n=1 Tax=Glycomyces luteolus TaxID=2670330 RepID=A0A9X3PAY6_9ACTN|nr:sigma-70 family RNA polymerase sigma factor [Glycomyces luteolus]MDA1361702.1 sigma-70 family RNA polymerase sigma factor [Glycomyces luteolus]
MPRQRSTKAQRGASLLTDQQEVERVRAVLALGGVPWDDLDDALQEVRLKLLQSRSKPALETIRSPGAWASVIASRVAADWHRSRKRDIGLRERLAARWTARPPEHPQEDRDLALAVAERLELLTDLQRQVVALRFYVDLPVRDIALVLEIPEGTVKSRLNSAVAALRSRMKVEEIR